MGFTLITYANADFTDVTADMFRLTRTKVFPTAGN